MRFDWLNTEICVTIARNAADGGYTKKFVARNVAEVGRDSTAAILRATTFGVDTRCNSGIPRNIARNVVPCIRALSNQGNVHNSKEPKCAPKYGLHYTRERT